MNKTYLIVLSSLIACSSRAMDEEYSHIRCYKDAGKAIEDILRYRHNDRTAVPEQFRAIYIADKKIQKLGTSNLTEDEMLGKIEEVLKPYESMPAVSEEILDMYQYNGIKALKLTISGRVHRFDVNKLGSRVALEASNDTFVIEEKSRGAWAVLKSYKTPYWIEDMVLTGDGKYLVWKKRNNAIQAVYLDDNRLDELNVDYKPELEKKMESGQRFRLMGREGLEALAFNTAAKMINIERDGFTVKYQPTLREIAAHFVKQRQAQATAAEDSNPVCPVHVEVKHFDQSEAPNVVGYDKTKKPVKSCLKLIACSSRGMENKDLKGADLWRSLQGADSWRYATVDVDCIHKIYAADQEIKKEVAGLRDAGELTENAVLAKIESALKMHAIDEAEELEFKHVYMHDDKVVSAKLSYIGGQVHKFHVNAAATGSRVALLFHGYYGTRQDISVCEEKSRGKWQCIKSMKHCDVKNIYLIDAGKKLAILDEQDNVSFEDLDATDGNLDHETFMEEFRKKHEENYPFFASGGTRETNVMEDETSSFCVGTHTPGKYIRIERDGFRADYTPNLQEIAQYLVRKAAQANK
jgi:hypothetical protein